MGGPIGEAYEQTYELGGLGAHSLDLISQVHVFFLRSDSSKKSASFECSKYISGIAISLGIGMYVYIQAFVSAGLSRFYRISLV